MNRSARRGPFRAVWALTLGLALSCAHIPDPQDPGVPDGYPIERVRLDGAENVDVGTLLDGLANRPPSFSVFRAPFDFFARDYFRFDELQTELDRRRIRSFYERRGYFSARVSGPELRRLPKGDRLEVIWTVSEGPPTRVRKIRLENAPDDLQSKLRSIMALDEGDIYTSAAFQASKTRLRALLVRRGYAIAKVEGKARIDTARGEADVVLDLEAGPRVQMTGLLAQGMVRTPTSAVTVRKTWNDGDLFNPVVLDRLRGRLYGIDQYAGVRLDFEGGRLRSERTRIVATVDEAERNELQLGIGLGLDPTTFQTRLRAKYKRRNFPLSLTNTTVEVVPTLQFLRERESLLDEPEFTPQGRVTVTWYDFLWPRFVLETDAGLQYQQLEAYEWGGFDAGMTLSRALIDDRLKAGLGWRFHQYTYADIRVAGGGDPAAVGLSLTPQEEINVDGPQSIIILQPSLTFEARDDVIEPTRGVFARAALDLGLATGADSVGFIQLGAELRGYLPAWAARLVAAGRLRVSSNLEGQLPAPRRVFAGGASSQRGFPQRRLSPLRVLLDASTRATVTDSSGEPILIPIGEETSLEMNLEMRLRLVKVFGFWLGMVGFLDGADIGARLGDLQLPELHFAAGGGLRYLTPVGAVRADYGYRLNRTGGELSCSGFDCGAFHISLGQAF